MIDCFCYRRGSSMALPARRLFCRSFHISSVALKQHKHKHRKIPPKVMNVNTCYRFPQFNRLGFQPQKYDYFLVLDFEATCEKDFKLKDQEIIEFPCLMVDSASFEVVNKFHDYIKPVINPELSFFCIQLTGILQDTVDDKPSFGEVLPKFLKWLSANKLETYGESANSIFVTCGDWDLKTMLPKQCQLSNLSVPLEMSAWINLKHAFHSSTGYFPRGITDMAAQLNVPFEGRLHSGIDDCRNIAKIMKGLAERGLVYQQTSALKAEKNDIKICDISPERKSTVIEKL